MNVISVQRTLDSHFKPTWPCVASANPKDTIMNIGRSTAAILMLSALPFSIPASADDAATQIADCKATCDDYLKQCLDGYAKLEAREGYMGSAKKCPAHQSSCKRGCDKGEPARLNKTW